VTDTYSPGDRQWLAKKRTSQIMVARADWRADLDDIAWEHKTFHNDIPFSGDARPTEPKAKD